MSENTPLAEVNAPSTAAVWRAYALLALALVAGLAARLTLAFTDDGIHWPDEIYQSLEPAHRSVFGYGWIAWEFVDGARHWLFPGMVAGLFKLALALDLIDPEGYLGFTRAVLCVASVGTAASVTVLARRLGSQALPSALGGAVFALMGTAIYFAPRGLSEVASALPLTLGLALTLPKPSRTFEVVVGCALLSLATMMRLQNAIWCVGLLGVFTYQRRWPALKTAMGALASGALVYGAIDALTWGQWFHSALVYLRFNLVEGRASDFGTAHPAYYFVNMVRSEPWLLLSLVGLSAYAWRENAAPGVLMVLFFGVHSLIPHKELRFVFPLYALLCATAAVGLHRLWGQNHRLWKLAAAGLAVLAIASSAWYPHKAFASLGIRNLPPGTSSLDYGGPENRLLLVAGRRSDVCGVHLRSLEHWRTGGYSYFHLKRPLYPPERYPGLANANYAIAMKGEGVGVLVAEDNGRGLYRLADAVGCAEDTTYDWTLEGVIRAPAP